jgi:hypothetical protein
VFKKLIACVMVLMGLSYADIISINFDDGTASGILTDQYTGFGVNFSNTQFSNKFALAGMTSPLGINGMGGGWQYSFGKENAIIADFSVDVVSVSIVGIDVGLAGARIDAFDSDGNLLDFNEVYGTGAGVGQFFTVAAEGAYISRMSLYQPDPGYGDGMLFDNLVFKTASVPEPAMSSLLFTGLLCFVGYGLKKRKN